MIVTPFGDLAYEDPEALKRWMMAHAIRHRAYTQALLRSGITPSAPPLMDQLGDPWLLNHWSSHSMLAKQGGVTGDTFGLSRDFQSDESQFYNWHRIHNLAHTRLDQIFKITSN